MHTVRGKNYFFFFFFFTILFIILETFHFGNHPRIEKHRKNHHLSTLISIVNLKVSIRYENTKYPVLRERLHF